MLGAIPRDIFRLLVQYLALEELAVLEKALLVNSELSSHYLSCLQGILLLNYLPSSFSHRKDQEFDWIIDHGIFVDTLTFECQSRRDLLDIFRPTLRSISFKWRFPSNQTPVIANEIAQAGQFASLTSLDLQHSAIDDATLCSFLKLHPRLESLNLTLTTKLTAEIIPVLTDCCPNLRKLYVAENRWVTDDPRSISFLTQGCRNLTYLGMWATQIYQESTILLLINSFPNLSALYFDIDDFSEDAISVFLQQVLFRAICSEEPEAQLLAIRCLHEYLELHDAEIAFTRVNFCNHFLLVDQSSAVVRRLVFVLTSQYSLDLRALQIAILRLLRRLLAHQELLSRIVEAINDLCAPNQFVNLLRALSGEEVATTCAVLLLKLVEKKSLGDLNSYEILTVLKPIVRQSFFPVEDICNFVASIVSRSATEGRYRDLLLDSEILLELLRLSPKTNVPIVGVSKIIALGVAINDDILIDHLVHTRLIPFLIDHRRGWRTHVRDIVKTIIDFRMEYLTIFEKNFVLSVDDHWSSAPISRFFS